MSVHGKHMIGPPMDLGETVFQMVQEKKTKTPEFEKLVQFFGRKRLLELYEAEKLKRCKPNTETQQDLSASSDTDIDQN